MTKQDIMDNLLEQNNGYLLTADVVGAGISKPYMQDFVKKRSLERVAQGVYMSEDAWLDELYIIHLRNKEVVFSHETALHLHGLMEREPTEIMLTVGRAYNASHLRSKGYLVHTVSKELLEMGKATAETAYGNTVSVYDIDRTICDMVRCKDKMDIQVFGTAMKEYMQSRKKNLNSLMTYAKAFGIEDTVRMYTEVML